MLVLLLASANIANLLLAKGVSRRKEMGIRAAIGAGRGRLIAQVLTESLVLCLIGALAGIGLAYLMIEAATPLLGPDAAGDGVAVARPPGAGLCRRGRDCASRSSSACCRRCRCRRGALGNAAGLTARGSSSREGARRLIVAAEVAISLVLVCGAVLMFKSLLKLQQVDAGVRIDNVITMSADLSIGTYPDSGAAARFIEAVGDRLRGVPGVDRAAVSTDVPHARGAAG